MSPVDHFRPHRGNPPAWRCACGAEAGLLIVAQSEGLIPGHMAVYGTWAACDDHLGEALRSLDERTATRYPGKPMTFTIKGAGQR